MTSDEQQFTPYAWEALRSRWERDEITLAQLSGQLLVWSQQLHAMLVSARRAQEGMENALDDLENRVLALEEQAEQE